MENKTAMSFMTAMQELIDYIEMIQSENFISDVEYILDNAKALLEKEKQQIENAYNSGANESNLDNGENYYNQTFKNK